MKDMLGRTISAGDLFLIPGGNVRYGGLVLEIGIVLSMTEKRLKTLVTRFDKIKLKPTTKTSIKVFKLDTTLESFMGGVNMNEELFYTNEAVLSLKAAYKNLQ
jgi:hypothetical protein